MAERADASSWRAALRRLTGALRPTAGRRRSPWSAFVPVVALLAGVLFTVSARAAGGTDLREDRTPQLVNIIGDRQRQVAAAQQQLNALQNREDSDTTRLAGSDTGVAQAQRLAGDLLGAAGLQAVHGPGVTVALNDAPSSGGTPPKGATLDELVVHQQDVQAVVNALWAGGAEAMTIMGVRVISTSAVRCVGNTLLLEGVLYSPPFTITAIGSIDAMRTALDSSPAVGAFRQAVAAWGLGYSVRSQDDVTLPAYTGSISLQYATATGTP